MIVSVDPGHDETGAAIWLADGELMRAALLRNPLETKAGDATRWRKMKDLLDAFLLRVVGEVPVRLVVEMPRLTPRSSGTRGRVAAVAPNDIVRLAGLVGALSTLEQAWEVELPHPEDWKRQTPKAISTARSKAALRPAELRRVELPPASLAHNVWDAVGIGLRVLRKERRALGAPLPRPDDLPPG